MNTATAWSAIAFNTAPDSQNEIHSDKVARQYGFKGGLVPGVTVSAYLMHPAVEAGPCHSYTSGLTRCTDRVGTGANRHSILRERQAWLAPIRQAYIPADFGVPRNRSMAVGRQLFVDASLGEPSTLQRGAET